MKNRKGLTLIEVLLALVLLSILLITYITVFGQNALLVSKGKRITNQTFDYQELMENNMVNTKKEFSSNNSMVKDGEIEIFSTYPNYKTSIDIKKVETKINENRKYTAFLSRFEIKEPKPPKLDPFTVKIYNKGKTKEVFPWFEDEIRLIGEYNLHDEPKIFENTTRWYRSLEDEINPVFSSDYSIVEATDKTVQEPESKNYNDELISKERLAKRFYYFEARPYTFAGRIEHYRNEDRILVLNRAGSKEWQDFMEDIYFKTTNIKKFTTNSQEIYLDIFQNPNHPTLNLDWQENKDPEGALLGMKIPDEYKSKNFETKVDFQFEEQRLNDSKELGIGIGLVNNNNTGIMIDIEPIKNSINFRFVKNGKRDLSKSTTNLSELNQDMEIDWKEKITLSIGYNSDKIVLQLSNESKSSKIIEVPATGINPEFVGLKSYSTTNYMPDLKYEIYNKYDRNYSSHFYNIEFDDIDDWIIDDGSGGNYFYNNANQNNIILKAANHADKKIKLNRIGAKLAGNEEPFIAKGLWFGENIVKLEISNNDRLIVNSLELIFDTPIEFKNNSSIEFSGIDSNSYPIKLSLKSGTKIKIDNMSEYILKEGDYIQIDSGTVILKGGSVGTTINISGAPVTIIKK